MLVKQPYNRSPLLERCARKFKTLPITITTPLDLRRLAAASIVFGLLAASAFAWRELIRQQHSQLPWLDHSEEPRSTWQFPSEQLAVMIALMSFALHLISRFLPTPSASLTGSPITGLLNVIAVYGGTAAALAALLSSRGLAAARATGLKYHPISRHFRNGAWGFLIAVLPMAVSMALTAPLRTRDTQNPLLRLLADSPGSMTIVLIVISAVIIAPLSEEMIYRVLLQGWLSTRMPPRLAIPLVACAFCSVHGLVDGMALIPLALVLGVVFHQSHSYLTVVVIHGLFNATMLALQLLVAK